MIRFSVAILERQELDWQGEEPAALLELENDPMLTAAAPVTYQLHAKLVSGGVLVTGSVGTVVTGVCGRCLEPVRRKVENTELSLFYEPEGASEIDVTDDVRAELLLALPVNLLCRDDCAGLCPVCGGNRNAAPCACTEPDAQPDAAPEDSPWESLNALKKP